MHKHVTGKLAALLRRTIHHVFSCVTCANATAGIFWSEAKKNILLCLLFLKDIGSCTWIKQFASFLQDNVPENLESVAEFEAPPSPDSSYGQGLLGDEDFAKDPVAVPPQLHLTVLGSENSEETPSSPKPQHVVLNHLFIEKGWASQSVVALGLTQRFQSKYVTVVLYKPLKR